MDGWRARIGFICPDSAKRDHDYFRMAPDGVSVHFTRVAFSGNGTLAAIGAMSNTDNLVAAARLLAALEPHCIAWSDTSGSFMFGPRGDREQVAAIEAATGIPASTTSTGVLAALAALGARRIAAAAPYLAEVSDKIPDFLAANGIETLSMRTLGLAHEREISRASMEVVYRLAREAMTEGAQALFVSCTDFFPIDLIEPIERDLGVPVVTANQATMWHALRRAGIRDVVAGFGRLMSLDLPEAAKGARRTA